MRRRRPSARRRRGRGRRPEVAGVFVLMSLWSYPRPARRRLAAPNECTAPRGLVSSPGNLWLLAPAYLGDLPVSVVLLSVGETCFEALRVC